MIKEIKLPEVSDNVETGDVVKVLVSVGDKIKVDQPLIELETDKALFEVPSTEEGVVTEVNVKEGDVLRIGAVIIKLESDKPSAGKIPESVNGVKKEAEVVNNIPAEEVKEKIQNQNAETIFIQPAESVLTETKQIPYSGETAPASPSVRRLARELGVEINYVRGSGQAGRITEDDLKLHVKSKMTSAAGNNFLNSSKPLPDFKKFGEVEIQPMSKVRVLTAESMTYAWTTIPMVTQFDKADITGIEEFRKKYISQESDKGKHLTITSILTKICSAALKEFPQFNSSIDLNRKEITLKKYFNIGIAVDTDRGLLVPVIKDTDKKSINEISNELNSLAEKARNKKITPEEMDGGNFTISNLGGIGGTGFSPIVYSPQVAILGVSRGSKEAVYINDSFEPRLMLPLSLTYDHRIIDGADAARFLRWICSALENPLMMNM
jgi:pyruvate dehydrogenase E2 component (dihydrolipoamide acetyltransferase)